MFWFLLGLGVGFVGAFTWPKWTAYLERRAAASKVTAAQQLLDGAKAAEKALAAAKVTVLAAMPPIPPNPFAPTGTTGSTGV